MWRHYARHLFIHPLFRCACSKCTRNYDWGNRIAQLMQFLVEALQLEGESMCLEWWQYAGGCDCLWLETLLPFWLLRLQGSPIMQDSSTWMCSQSPHHSGSVRSACDLVSLISNQQLQLDQPTTTFCLHFKTPLRRTVCTIGLLLYCIHDSGCSSLFASLCAS